MVSNISNALSAYQQALSRIGNQSPVQEAPAQNINDSFSSMVKSAVESASNAQKSAEQISIAGIQGKADIQDVVQAISNAQLQLETVVAVRDTAIKAYQTIIQMQI